MAKEFIRGAATQGQCVLIKQIELENEFSNSTNISQANHYWKCSITNTMGTDYGAICEFVFSNIDPTEKYNRIYIGFKRYLSHKFNGVGPNTLCKMRI